MQKELILLHGALGSKHQFDGLIPKLTPNFKVHTFDFAGHGNNPDSPSFSMHSFANQTLQFIEEQAIQDPLVFGYSMGGYVALTAALLSPKKICHIVTLGTKFDWSITATEQEIKKLNPEVIQEKVPHFASFLEKQHPAHNWKDVVSNTAQLMLGLSSHDGLSNKDLNAINTPVTVCLGSLDNMVSREESLAAVNELENAKFKTFEGYYHLFEKNDPLKLAALLESLR